MINMEKICQKELQEKNRMVLQLKDKLFQSRKNSEEI